MTHNREKIEKLLDEEIAEEEMYIHQSRSPQEIESHYRKKGRLVSLRRSIEKLDR
jgi:hypothetical protein